MPNFAFLRWKARFEKALNLFLSVLAIALNRFSLSTELSSRSFGKECLQFIVSLKDRILSIRILQQPFGHHKILDFFPD
ncbi:MAG TPA: hypothetical protein DGG95_05175 [Cytophagales bacterium]|nr:hypothetical protein [Cytophagales bacterium]